METHSNGSGTSVEADDRWHVRLPGGDVHVVDVDQLDSAFQNGLINESTLVWQPGMDAWQPLGVAAGLTNDAAPAGAPANQETRPTSPPALSASPPSSPQTILPPPSQRSASVTDAHYEARRSSAPPSLVPVTSASSPDLSLDDDLAFAPKRSSRKLATLVAGLAAAAVIGAVALTGTNAKPDDGAPRAAARPAAVAALPEAPVAPAPRATTERAAQAQQAKASAADLALQQRALDALNGKAPPLARVGKAPPVKPVKARKAGAAGSEYDPLNGDL
jgi:hypothetical protein